MNLTLSYETDAKEFAHASFIFMESRPFFRFLVYTVNIAILLILGLLAIKKYQTGLVKQEWAMGIMMLIWLMARKPFNRWILDKKFDKKNFEKQTLQLECSLNGLSWSGQKFAKGELPWHQLKYVVQTNTGFLFPLSATQFLWLPERAFSSATEKSQFITLLSEKNIPLKGYKA